MLHSGGNKTISPLLLSDLRSVCKLSKPAVCQHAPLRFLFEGLVDFPLVSQHSSTSHTNRLPAL
ncbi:hypothetical protein NQZ68_029018 [Dissostichus eleginoides]|nr:hypothetical protein NQZ68_029018 [Dissostichus eleginoides]